MTKVRARLLRQLNAREFRDRELWWEFHLEDHRVTGTLRYGWNIYRFDLGQYSTLYRFRAIIAAYRDVHYGGPGFIELKMVERSFADHLSGTPEDPATTARRKHVQDEVAAARRRQADDRHQVLVSLATSWESTVVSWDSIQSTETPPDLTPLLTTAAEAVATFTLNMTAPWTEPEAHRIKIETPEPTPGSVEAIRAERALRKAENFNRRNKP